MTQMTRPKTSASRDSIFEIRASFGIRHSDFVIESVPVAQLDRVSDFGSDGWGFESLQARQQGRNRVRTRYDSGENYEKTSDHYICDRRRVDHELVPGRSDSGGRYGARYDESGTRGWEDHPQDGSFAATRRGKNRRSYAGQIGLLATPGGVTTDGCRFSRKQTPSGNPCFIRGNPRLNVAQFDKPGRF